MMNQTAYLPAEKFKKAAKIGFFIMVAVYLIDCFTPLRLHVDTIRYFAIKDYLEFHYPKYQFGYNPYYSFAATDYFPYGYTALLLIFSKLGILKSFFLVLINCIYLFGGLYFIYKTFEKKTDPYFYFLLVLLNWLFVKFVTHPLSEMQYIFFSSAGIFFFNRFLELKKIRHLLLAILLGWLAMMTRTIGITLVAAIVAGLLWEYKEQQLNFLRKNKILVSVIVVVIAAGLIIFSRQIGLNHYTDVLSAHFKEASFFKRVRWRFKEWGELFINVPSNKIIDRVAASEWVFVIIGLLIFCWFMFMLFFRQKNIPFFIKAYLLFYSLIMFNWPFNDPRFWVPVMPVIAVIVLLSIPVSRGLALRWILTTQIVVYILLGAFSAGYMVYSSLDRKFFVKNQAKGVFRNEYETHFYGKPQTDTAKKIDPYILHVLQKFD